MKQENLSKNEPMPGCPAVQIRKLYDKTKLLNDDEFISLELVLTTCFPTVWNNIRKAMTDNYTQGYLDAKKEFEQSNDN